MNLEEAEKEIAAVMGNYTAQVLRPVDANPETLSILSLLVRSAYLSGARSVTQLLIQLDGSDAITPSTLFKLVEQMALRLGTKAVDISA